MRISRDTEMRPTDIDRFYISPVYEWIMIIVYLIFYCAMCLQLRDFSRNPDLTVVIFGITFNNYIFSGLGAEVQVLCSTYLSIKTMKKGYITLVVANSFGIVFASFNVITSGNQYALPGIATYFGSIVISAVIYYYKKGLYHNFTQLNEQKDEMLSLYEEISASQDKLSQQNEQLIKFNKAMKENEKKLEHMAYFDGLTGLPNRKMIIKKLDMLIHYSIRNNSGFSLVYIDIDNFKEVNELMGHQIGDMILQTVSERWKRVVHKRDVLGRIGGDEFAVVIRREMSKEETLCYVKTLKDAISDVFRCEMKEFNINASFGISSYPEDGETTEDLLKHADIALASVKNAGKNGIEFFCTEMQKNMLERVLLENGLKSAIVNDELYVVFQPQYFCDTDNIRGFEALARWRSASLGSVSPAQFIPIAEETGLIIDIGEWILSTVLSKFKKIQKLNKSDYILTINISVVQIIQPSFVKTVKKVLEETQFDTSCLEFEITESVFISYPDKVIEALNQLKKMGISIALDDFGTGYASLKYLQMLPIDTLKIDRTFVSRIGELESGKHIVGTIIALAHSLDILVVAEGVENTTQLEYLKEQDCDCMQGFLLSRPLEDEQFNQLVATA